MWRKYGITYWFILIIVGAAIKAPFGLDDKSRWIILGTGIPFLIWKAKQICIKKKDTR